MPLLVVILGILAFKRVNGVINLNNGEKEEGNEPETYGQSCIAGSVNSNRYFFSVYSGLSFEAKFVSWFGRVWNMIITNYDLA